MLTAIARQAIVHCLTELGDYARDEQLPMLAALIQLPSWTIPTAAPSTCT